jgi:hypothetical protein
MAVLSPKNIREKPFSDLPLHKNIIKERNTYSSESNFTASNCTEILERLK